MNSNGLLQKHWVNVTAQFVTDALLFAFAMIVGTRLWLGTLGLAEKITEYWPSIFLGALFLPCIIYICGLYSPRVANDDFFKRALVLALCFVAAVGFMMGLFYLNYSGRIGRGVMIVSGLLAYFLVFLHHALMLYRTKNYRERVALIVTCPFDEVESELFDTFWSQHLELAGVIHYDSYRPDAKKNKVLGPVSDISRIVEEHRIDRVLCTDKSINDPAMCRQFCQLRYSGVTVVPLISLCEEVYQMVPLELVTPEWLLNASASPHMLYIRKVKRAFDIVVSLVGLLFLGPFMIAGIIATKLTSPGPVFYYQVRSGRFGKPIKVIKLRTMRVDAEKNGAVWAATKDSRVTPVCGFLRKYRIDEIPQIINVLRGEMSFVGPRPERPEFVEMLSKQIPYFGERLMVQPGITGWAQVSYPYGSSVDDAKRKLEYDLYYAKHMSLFLDIFILLDTVRIIVRGGVNEASKQGAFSFDTARKRRAEIEGALKEASLLN